MQRRTRLPECLAPLLVLGVLLAAVLGGLSGPPGRDSALVGGPATSNAGPEFRATPSTAGRADLDVADLRHGGARPAEPLRTLGGKGHTGAAVLPAGSPRRLGATAVRRPSAAVRLVLEVVSPRLGRAPPAHA